MTGTAHGRGRRLRRELALRHVTASGVGIIIGAGIYVLLGSAAAEAGAAVWLSFGVAGVLSVLTALSYAELAAMFPAAGAEYDYTRHVAPEWIAFLIGWVMTVGLIIAAGAVALGFAHYLRHFVDVPVEVGGAAVVVAVTLVALVGIRQSARLTLAFSLVQVGGLLLVVAIGIPHVGDHSLVSGISLGGVVSGAALVFFAFIGFDEVITLAEETRDPVRTVPRGLFLALGISTLLYVAVAVAGVSVLGAGGLAASEQPLASVMRTAVGPGSADLVAAIAMVTTFNTTLLLLTASSRLQYGMAARGALPARLGRVSGRRVPAAAVLVASGGALVGVALGDLTLVASVTDFSVYLVFVAVNLTVIVLRARQPRRLRPFRVPLAVGPVPIPTVAALVVVLAMLPGLDPVALGLGAALVGVGLLVHGALRRLAPRSARPARPVGEDEAVRRRDVTLEEAAAVMAALRVDPDAVPWDVEQFRMGLASELAHGRVDPDTNVTDDDLVTTGKIALAHLVEIPDYYTRLAAMEAEAFEEQAHRRDRPG
jgi:APA family basic amino acid/polyamine antiporter